MKLTEEQKSSVSFHVTSQYGKLTYAKCTMCGSKDFSLSEEIIDLPFFGRDGGLVNPIAEGCHPAIALICNRCGHIELFSASKLVTL